MASGFDRCPRVYYKDGVTVECFRPQSPGGNRWCLTCRAEYRRWYDRMKAEKTARRAFQLGAQKMRTACLEAFRKLETAEMSGYTAFEIVARVELPPID